MNQIVKELLSDAKDHKLDLHESLTFGDTIRFYDLPLPPTSNNMYATIRRGGKSIHVSSKQLRDYQAQMDLYPFRFPRMFAEAKKKMDKWMSNGMLLEFHAVFVFEESKIFTKDHRVKKMDVSNRIKALHDSISALLGCDDSVYFRIFAEKTTTNRGGREMAAIQILPYR